MKGSMSFWNGQIQNTIRKRLPHCGGQYPGWRDEEVNDMQEITVAEALAAWEQAGQTVEINDGRCQWTE